MIPLNADESNIIHAIYKQHSFSTTALTWCLMPITSNDKVVEQWDEVTCVTCFALNGEHNKTKRLAVSKFSNDGVFIIRYRYKNISRNLFKQHMVGHTCIYSKINFIRTLLNGNIDNIAIDRQILFNARSYSDYPIIYAEELDRYYQSKYGIVNIELGLVV